MMLDAWRWDAMMIESGTCTPGIAAAAFGLPPNTALRYEHPADALRPFFPSYAVLHSEADSLGESRPGEWMLPTWAQIWIVLEEKPISVKIGNRAYDPLHSVILYGVTSRAMPVVASGGTTIVIDVSPLGWARFIPQTAELLSDRITPLADVLPAKFVKDLVKLLKATKQARNIKSVLDEFLLAHMPAANADELHIAKLMALLTKEDVVDLSQGAEAVAITPRTVRRLSKRYFGFPPKLLIMRARTIRAVVAMLLADESDSHPRVPSLYYDASHFNRDGRRFLGTTPRRFIDSPMPYLRAALRARQLVIGYATPCLDVWP